MNLEIKKDLASNWFKTLQDAICNDISNFENGVYIIQMSDNFNTKTQRFIRQ